MDEIEAKYRVPEPSGHARLRDHLQTLGAVCRGTERERNVLFDRPDGAVHKAGQVLRLRELDGGPGGRLTVKGPASYSGASKRRLELETGVDDCAVVQAQLE